MGHQNRHYPLFLLFFLFSQNSHAHSWSWFSPSKETLIENLSENGAIFNDIVGDFSMESLNNRKGIQLVENARKKMVASNLCWQNAYQNLFAGCSEILASEEKRSRLAWHLSNCFQKDSGRPHFPHCNAKSSMLKCLTKLDEDARKIYLETDAFKRQTERLVNELKKLQEKQATTKDKLEESMAKLHESSNKVGEEISNLKNQAIEIEEEISKVGNAMSSKMNTLQQRADDIGNMAGISLEKQKQVLDGQSLAFEGLKSLTKFQLQALEENRGTLQEFAELGNRQQEELLRRQELLQHAHDHLSSKTILADQYKANLCCEELATIRYAPDDIEQQAWIISVVRSLAVVLASIQLLHAIFTYRDYELLNYQMLVKLNENLTEQFYGKQRNKEELWDVDMDSEMNWSSWVDTELPEDLDNLEDLDCILPEEVEENSVATTIITKKYNLRSQQYHLQDRVIRHDEEHDQVGVGISPFRSAMDASTGECIHPSVFSNKAAHGKAVVSELQTNMVLVEGECSATHQDVNFRSTKTDIVPAKTTQKRISGRGLHVSVNFRMDSERSDRESTLQNHKEEISQIAQSARSRSPF
ncbi:hypothetical protein TEA_009203 [Camellia sinensis var. sinensis]|uniref:Protein GAMETE EXPRESSED 1 n=1 Tax=Camellia sinensis var. sinensis TaxID=542762 RepID=A0A4S4EY05_CAMSN|nr:hypothetical protein TEA_009203 [Camellia sinensis var. sinensis]